ncbi:N,N-dimethylformamidase beta subunit family domain-containing protein [Mycobacterium innocens]|nr:MULTISPECIES: N,N-dimethylformamidase beta subunit family domain-containing protein [Mycobacterium]
MSTQAYPRQPSVRAGERLMLHVSTPAPRYRVRFLRIGCELEPVGESSWRRGFELPPGLPDRDWGWPGELFDVPKSWRSGAYLAVIDTGQDDQPPIDLAARCGQALFVVRPAASARRAPILYKVPLATYHAYNAAGGGSMYHTASFVPSLSPTVLTTRRPGGGTGGAPSFPEAVDVYDPSSPREGVAHWDVPMIAWLQREGVDVDFCTDFDLHRDPAVLDGHRLLLSVGHDEYWSPPMRQAAEDFVRRGGNIAFFSGNTSWWRVDLTDNGDLTAVHPPVSHPGGGNWWRTRPENRLTGVSYRHGGGWWDGPREPLGYTVQHAGHWVYGGLNLRTGDVFGSTERLVGYECDGAVVEPGPGGRLRAAGTDGTPAELAVLGTARLGEGWQDRPAGPAATAVLGAYTDTGTVFTCGTTDWPRLLAQGDPVVTAITRNVLGRLAGQGARVLGPFPARHGRWLVVAGQDATFQVDLRGPAPEGTTFTWTIAVGDCPAKKVPGALTCQLAVPDVADLLTVTVTVTSPDGQTSFGWTTQPILSAAEFAQIDVLCRLRDLVVAVAPALNPVAEVGTGNRPFGDPAWDPVRDGLRKPMTPEAFDTVITAATELTERCAPFAGRHDRIGSC